MAALLLGGVGLFYNQKAYGAPVDARSLTLDNSEPGASAKYVISFTIPTAGTVGSVQAEFCENTALFDLPCNAPAGLDLTVATLSAQSGATGFTIDPLTTANVLILSRIPGAVAATTTVSFTLDGVKSASAAGSQYARFSTFASADATGSHTDRGSVAYSLNPLFQVSSEVPPFLQFCVAETITGTDCNTATGDYVNMGTFRTTNASTGKTQAVVATNAANGYSVLINGSTMVSGNNEIPQLTTPTNSAPGISQFGINLRANSDPQSGEDPSGAGVGFPTTDYNQPNRFVYRNGDIIASRADVEDFRKFTITYLVNISRAQPPGVYTSTFVYTGIGNF